MATAISFLICVYEGVQALLCMYDRICKVLFDFRLLVLQMWLLQQLRDKYLQYMKLQQHKRQ